MNPRHGARRPPRCGIGDEVGAHERPLVGRVRQQQLSRDELLHDAAQPLGRDGGGGLGERPQSISHHIDKSTVGPRRAAKPTAG